MDDKDDAAELTGDTMKQARRGRDMLLEAVPSKLRRGAGRPPADRPKVPVSIRLDRDVVDHFKATGDGWQTRINSILREAAAGRSVARKPQGRALKQRA